MPALSRARASVRQPVLSTGIPLLFDSPAPAGRRITAGFTFMQRIGKSANIDVWFPQILRQELDALVAAGRKLGPEHFPAEWAAVRQFELLQESGNYKVYDLDATHLTRTLDDLSHSMRAGGYRITVATIGSYDTEAGHDDLEILDRRLQDRLAHLTHMLYLEDQSEAINAELDAKLAAGAWDYRTALPHVGATLGARDIFSPVSGGIRETMETLLIAREGVAVSRAAAWVNDIRVVDAETGAPFHRVPSKPKPGQYSVDAGVYVFAGADAGREVMVAYAYNAAGEARKLSNAEHRHRLARHFFDIVSMLPQKHVMHDTAIGLQLPESNSENEWIYMAEDEDTFRAFNLLMRDLFAPFDGVSLGMLHEREGAGTEVKATVQHLRAYGDRLNGEADAFYANLARFAP